jgi:hypothetical protein
LVAEEVEIDPLAGAPPFVAVQNLSVELASLVQIANADRQVKWRKAIHS